jgi:hypothetical protein
LPRVGLTGQVSAPEGNARADYLGFLGLRSPLQIVDCGEQEIGIVLEVPDSLITVETQQTAHFARLVIVVYVELVRVKSSSCYVSGLPTNRTPVRHGVEFVDRQVLVLANSVLL